MDIALKLFNIFIYPGFLFCFFAGLLIMGIDRKVVARMQKRIGPPILQPFYDFFKLIGKETIVPRDASKIAFLSAPALGMISLITVVLFIPVFGFHVFSTNADWIVILYLITIAAVCIIIGGASSGSPYAGVGISREMVSIISYELPFVIILLAVSKKVGLAMGSGEITFTLADMVNYQVQNGSMITNWSMIPAAVAMLLIIPCKIGSVPFDTAEAETEICEGPLVEYSGAPLAIYKLNQGILMLVMGSLFTILFLGGIGFNSLCANAVLQFFITVLITVLSVSIVKAVVGRIKIEQTFKFFWIVPTGLSMMSLIFAYMGL